MIWEKEKKGTFYFLWEKGDILLFARRKPGRGGKVECPFF
jgi:hypothetical protein